MPTLVFHLDDGSVFTHTLEEGTTTIGRHPDSVVVLEFPSVSGHHAVIEFGDGGCFLADQKSSNGTRINGVAIEEARLNPGDQISFGDVQAVFQDDTAAVQSHEPAFTQVPMPVVPPVEAPPPMPKRNYRPTPPPRNRGARVNSYPDTSGSGCATAAIVIALFISAFLAGLYLRHHKETGGNNFFNDFLDSVGSDLPKIKIEKTVDPNAP
jgi:hypothetical protein